MSAYSLAAALKMDPASGIAPPEKSHIRGEPPLASIELENRSAAEASATRTRSFSGAITPAGAQTPYEARPELPSGFQTPMTPDELESNGPSSQRAIDAARIVPSWSYPSMNKWRVLCACVTYFGNGMNDSAPGALIPYMEKDYNIGYAIVSLIFVTNAVGFILTAFATDSILAKLGRAKSLILAEAIMLVGYVMIVTTPPFGVVVAAYLFLGLGYALNLALNNVFCANLANSTVILGAAHGSYGIGGIVGPIVATAIASRGIVWSRFYLITLAVRVAVIFFAGWAFHGHEQEETTRLNARLERMASRQRATETGETSRLKLLKRSLKTRTTLIGALFIFAYQGAEVSISGWVISYLISYREGDPAKVGYVTSGFWAGITLGRFILSHLAPRVGEKLFVYVLIAGAIAFQLLTWLIPNVIGDAVAVAVVGLLLGPVYPCSQTIFTRLLPAQIQMTSIGFISSAGSSGGAVAPFTTGLLAQAAGTFVLHPIAIGLFAVMGACWFALPKIVKRSE